MRKKKAMFSVTFARVLSLLVAIGKPNLLHYLRDIWVNTIRVGGQVLPDERCESLVVNCTICGFFRYFRSNKLEGGRTIAHTNLTKNEFL